MNQSSSNWDYFKNRQTQWMHSLLIILFCKRTLKFSASLELNVWSNETLGKPLFNYILQNSTIIILKTIECSDVRVWALANIHSNCQKCHNRG